MSRSRSSRSSTARSSLTTVWRGRLVVATRGSFVSPQARLAEGLLHERYPDAVSAMEEGKTYLFELIHPKNRIVVDYGAEEALYLIAVVENDSGKDLAPLGKNVLPVVPVVCSYAEYADLSALPERANAEGYVVRFASGLRFKVKHPEYVRVHRLISHATPKHVWEYLERGEDPLSDLDGVPDEVYGALEGYADDLRARYSAIETAATGLHEVMNGELGEEASRKEKALWIRERERSLQPVLSGKDYSRTIWREIKPRGDYT